jgi:hypothetical protein
VQHIADTGLPIVYQTPFGKLYSLPVFSYLLSFATLFVPEKIVYLVLPNVLAVLAHAAVYYLVLELTGKEQYALLGALGSVFVPAYLTATLLTVSPLALAAPLLLTCVTLYLKLRKSKEHRLLLLALFILLSLTHPIALIAIPFLILSLLLTTVREARGEVAQQEFAVFALFYLIWLYVLLYKNFLSHFGLHIFIGNTPQQVVTQMTASVTPQLLATQLGVVLFGLALYATYKETAGQHIGIQAVIALALSMGLALLFHAVLLPVGLACFGLVCAVLAAVGWSHITRFAQQLRRPVWRVVLTAVIALLFTLTSVVPTLTEGLRMPQHAVTQQELDAAAWLSENTPQNSLLLAPPTWGYFLESQAHRPVYLSTNYLRYPDPQARYETVSAVLANKTAAALTTPKSNYIVTAEPISISCAHVVYNQTVTIAKVLCS